MFSQCIKAIFLLQVATLKDQLAQEIKKRQQYIARSVRTGDEIRDIRTILDNSLCNVTRDSGLDPILLEHESRKLDESLEIHSSFPVRLPRHRSPVRGSSPIRLSGMQAFRRSGRSPVTLRQKMKQ